MAFFRAPPPLWPGARRVAEPRMYHEEIQVISLAPRNHAWRWQLCHYCERALFKDEGQEGREAIVNSSFHCTSDELFSRRSLCECVLGPRCIALALVFLSFFSVYILIFFSLLSFICWSRPSVCMP